MKAIHLTLAVLVSCASAFSQVSDSCTAINAVPYVSDSTGDLACDPYLSYSPTAFDLSTRAMEGFYYADGNWPPPTTPPPSPNNSLTYLFYTSFLAGGGTAIANPSYTSSPEIPQIGSINDALIYQTYMPSYSQELDYRNGAWMQISHNWGFNSYLQHFTASSNVCLSDSLFDTSRHPLPANTVLNPCHYLWNYSAVPGWNVEDAWYQDDAMRIQDYSWGAGIKSAITIGAGYFGEGDVNSIDLITTVKPAFRTDASAEGVVPFRNSTTEAEPFTATITSPGTTMGATKLTVTNVSNNLSLGHGQPLINTAYDVVSGPVTVTSLSHGTYGFATLTGAASSVTNSIAGTVTTTTLTIPPTANDVGVPNATFSISTNSTGVSLGDLMNLIGPNDAFQVVKLTSVSAKCTASPCAQTVQATLHYSIDNTTTLNDGGWVGRYVENTAYTLCTPADDCPAGSSGPRPTQRFLQYVISSSNCGGTCSSLTVGALVQDNPHSYDLVGANENITVYHGADILDVRDPSPMTNCPSGGDYAINSVDGCYVVIGDNDSQWGAGNTIEVQNYIAAVYSLQEVILSANNPFLSMTGYSCAIGPSYPQAAPGGAPYLGIDLCHEDSNTSPSSSYVANGGAYFAPQQSYVYGVFGSGTTWLYAPTGGNNELNLFAGQHPNITSVYDWLPCTGSVNCSGGYQNQFNLLETISQPFTSGAIGQKDIVYKDGHREFSNLYTKFDTAVDLPAVVVTGTTFAVAGCSPAGSIVGGASAGSFTAGAATCNPVITMGGGALAPHGWSCWMNDLTHNDLMRQTATTTSTGSFAGTVTTGDTLNFGCLAY